MIIYRNAEETKTVNITVNGGHRQIIAAYTQRHIEPDGRVDEQVLQYRYFVNIANATRWAKKVLGL